MNGCRFMHDILELCGWEFPVAGAKTVCAHRLAVNGETRRQAAKAAVVERRGRDRQLLTPLIEGRRRGASLTSPNRRTTSFGPP
jgi:hypothetical protein